MDDITHHRPAFLNGWRIAGWGAAAALLALPAIAMRFSGEVAWSPGDFLFAAVLLIALGLGIEIAMRLRTGIAGRAGMIVTSIAAFLTVWANGAVGIIGNEGEPVNQGFYALVLAALLAGAAARFRPRVMQWVCGLVAAGQLLLGFTALALMPGHGVEWGVLAFFTALWGGAALMFRKAAGR